MYDLKIVHHPQPEKTNYEPTIYPSQTEQINQPTGTGSEGAFM